MQVVKGDPTASKLNALWDCPSTELTSAIFQNQRTHALFSMLRFYSPSAGADLFQIANLSLPSPELTRRPPRRATAYHEIPDLQAKGGYTDRSGGHLWICRVEQRTGQEGEHVFSERDGDR